MTDFVLPAVNVQALINITATGLWYRFIVRLGFALAAGAAIGYEVNKSAVFAAYVPPSCVLVEAAR
jgi:hypothetical protein